MKIQLTARESETYAAWLQGKKSKDIADTLFVSKRTVDFHLSNIMAKTNTNSMREASNMITRGDDGTYTVTK